MTKYFSVQLSRGGIKLKKAGTCNILILEPQVEQS